MEEEQLNPEQITMLEQGALRFVIADPARRARIRYVAMTPIFGMPPGVDPAAVRAMLETDRAWTVYALADLAPRYSAPAEWRLAAGGRPALLLIYRAFRPPVLFSHGSAADLEPLLAGIAGEPEFYLSMRPEAVAALRAAGYQIRGEKSMWRMLLEARDGTLPPLCAVRLGPGDDAELARLYADGEAAGEAPQFFDAGMLAAGVYFGIRAGEELVAAAGTHVVAPQEGVAAIGNVYTRRDQRGRGFASRVTAAVTSELVRRGLRTVALNVEQTNGAAVRVYERLGFRRYCPYVEGMAVMRGAAQPA